MTNCGEAAVKPHKHGQAVASPPARTTSPADSARCASDRRNRAPPDLSSGTAADKVRSHPLDPRRATGVDAHSLPTQVPTNAAMPTAITARQSFADHLRARGAAGWPILR
jgi:hypothetical protein